MREIIFKKTYVLLIAVKTSGKRKGRLPVDADSRPWSFACAPEVRAALQAITQRRLRRRRHPHHLRAS